MKSFHVIVLAAALSAASTAAFAEVADGIGRQVDQQIVLGNYKASSSNPSGSAQQITEGRQASHLNAAPSATDQFLVDQAVERDANSKH